MQELRSELLSSSSPSPSSASQGWGSWQARPLCANLCPLHPGSLLTGRKTGPKVRGRCSLLHHTHPHCSPGKLPWCFPCRPPLPTPLPGHHTLPSVLLIFCGNGLFAHLPLKLICEVPKGREVPCPSLVPSVQHSHLAERCSVSRHLTRRWVYGSPGWSVRPMSFYFPRCL